MGCLASTGSKQSMGQGYFFDVFRYGVLANQDEGTMGVFPENLFNIFMGKNCPTRQGAAADPNTFAEETGFECFGIFKDKEVFFLFNGDHISSLQDIEIFGICAFKGKFDLLGIPAVFIYKLSGEFEQSRVYFRKTVLQGILLGAAVNFGLLNRDGISGNQTADNIFTLVAYGIIAPERNPAHLSIGVGCKNHTTSSFLAQVAENHGLDDNCCAP